MGPSPLANLSELREKYTYNITPFSPMHQQANSGEPNLVTTISLLSGAISARELAIAFLGDLLIRFGGFNQFE